MNILLFLDVAFLPKISYNSVFHFDVFHLSCQVRQNLLVAIYDPLVGGHVAFDPVKEIMVVRHVAIELINFVADFFVLSNGSLIQSEDVSHIFELCSDFLDFLIHELVSTFDYLVIFSLGIALFLLSHFYFRLIDGVVIQISI